ncbi:hypothetical protein GCM10010404_20120 [Nonomuraea africana]|uniref:Uncharacterized protein YbjT (DUF2867 family) n=1 Tax=Nonomuraea africana TaxID=46171 RepID=A0ABR9KU66_9ACTN|nr:hypothetical protein [Nonomuraea africana]MBE1565271.1 uncharacterized protein YbjT (DUF2867 family) [Nonomuraea africana]
MNCANNFNQNFDEDLWLEPLRAGRLALPIGETPEPFIDVEDVADVAAEVLARGGHSGQVYDLSGPRGLSFRAAVEISAGAAGRSIDYVELTPEVYRAELAASGYPEAAVAALDAMFAMHREGHTAVPADGVSRVLGRAPRRFEEDAKRVAASGVWSGTS